MNAKELFDIYGPLWLAAPDAKPTDIYFEDDSRMFGNIGGGDPVPSFWFNGGEVVCADVAAAALCRVAVEDYLDREWYSLIVTRTWPGPRVRWFLASGFTTSNDGQVLIGEYTDAPTKDHALVSAALAVAGSKT